MSDEIQGAAALIVSLLLLAVLIGLLTRNSNDGADCDG